MERFHSELEWRQQRGSVDHSDLMGIGWQHDRWRVQTAEEMQAFRPGVKMPPLQLHIRMGAGPAEIQQAIVAWLEAQSLTPEECTALLVCCLCGNGIRGDMKDAAGRIRTWPAIVEEFKRLSRFARRFPPGLFCFA